MLGTSVNGLKILVANIDGEFYAMNSTCNHRGGPLEMGTLEGNVVTCPLHGSKWDVKTGRLVQFMRQLPPEQVYQVKVIGDQLFVEM